MIGYKERYYYLVGKEIHSTFDFAEWKERFRNNWKMNMVGLTELDEGFIIRTRFKPSLTLRGHPDAELFETAVFNEYGRARVPDLTTQLRYTWDDADMCHRETVARVREWIETHGIAKAEQ